MKHGVIFLLTLILIFLVSCENKESGVIYQDGIFIGEGDHREFGYEVAEVTIKGDRITKIILKRMDTEGNEIDYDEWSKQKVDGKVKPDLQYASKELAAIMIDKQITDVDPISGATESSEGWKTAVARALIKAEK